MSSTGETYPAPHIDWNDYDAEVKSRETDIDGLPAQSNNAPPTPPVGPAISPPGTVIVNNYLSGNGEVAQPVAIPTPPISQVPPFMQPPKISIFADRPVPPRLVSPRSSVLESDPSVDSEAPSIVRRIGAGAVASLLVAAIIVPGTVKSTLSSAWETLQRGDSQSETATPQVSDEKPPEDTPETTQVPASSIDVAPSDEQKPEPSPTSVLDESYTATSVNMHGDIAENNTKRYVKEVLELVTIANNASVLALQGVSKKQFEAIKNELGNEYATIPATWAKAEDLTQRLLVWSTAEFEMLEQGNVTVPGDDANKLTQKTMKFPWVKLRYQAKIENVPKAARGAIYMSVEFTELEDPTVAKETKLDKGGAKKRLQQAQDIEAAVLALTNKHKVPVYVMGDIGSNGVKSDADKAVSTAELPAYQLTSGGILRFAGNIENSVKGPTYTLSTENTIFTSAEPEHYGVGFDTQTIKYTTTPDIQAATVDVTLLPWEKDNSQAQKDHSNNNTDGIIGETNGN